MTRRPAMVGTSGAAGQGFTVLPKRWIVERSIALLNRCRRPANDWDGIRRNRASVENASRTRIVSVRSGHVDKPPDPTGDPRRIARDIQACTRPVR